ncbi:metalloprotease [Haloarchaeobius sp. DYHT-AS-18]|uniref:metalloprotease n=1 Tax=Haloarchaeobius sp. DYHT-AS-18 TaxID=3446117 RepID=UPI003EBA0A2F
MVQFRFADGELKDLGIAWVALSVAFGILIIGPSAITRIDPTAAFRLLGFAAFTAGIGFLLHELAHKFTAMHFGYPAEFRADYNMLLLAVFSAMVGFLFAAPGAVYHPRTSKKESGLIAVAGPLTNVALVLVFFPLLAFGGTLGRVGAFGVFINAFLAGFNMIPYGPLDGRKVLNWSKPAFALTFLLCGGLGFAAFFGLLPTPF